MERNTLRPTLETGVLAGFEKIISECESSMAKIQEDGKMSGPQDKAEILKLSNFIGNNYHIWIYLKINL